MIWFGSSAGVALSNQYPEAKSVGQWIRHGWFIIPAYVIAFFCHARRLGMASRYATQDESRPSHRPASNRKGVDFAGVADVLLSTA